MITNTSPDNWKDLQNEVGEILSQCGFTVEVEKKVTTARGEAELDVYAEEIIKGRKYTIICECKFWKSKIPQSIIHGFRTILSDTGANKGYIICLKGFQSGSVKAANFTNLDLVTWEEFQSAFCNSWIENYFIPTITEELDPLLGYTEPLVQKWMCEVPDHEIETIKGLREKYLVFSIIVMSCTTYTQLFKRRELPSLPLSKNDKYTQEALEALPAEIKDTAGYREFLNECIKYGKYGINEFREVRARNNV